MVDGGDLSKISEFEGGVEPNCNFKNERNFFCFFNEVNLHFEVVL